ncbi:hypothetical protein RclHR1_04060013 [Rhizophagus clarus]|uniref:Superoxide dismutase copper/zinc binding domain-containing protein n=1 Tax=Rhizophagus clarus TaxID=94130 RepID=A0A2Z6RS66_9GLOM|nr:hypothetical protein RclHR1_04060013 [Rhizophagus clarus]
MFVALFDKGNGLEKGQEYPFHIHENSIKNNDCETAGFGKDPNYKCDPSRPDKCEVGDLSGKYGDLIPDDDGNVIKKDYDAFIKLDGSSGVTGRSVVIHLSDANQTRYDCANIIVQNHKRKRNLRFLF